MAQLLGMYHQRVAYPQNKVVELELGASRAAARAADASAVETRGPAATAGGQGGGAADDRHRSVTSGACRIDSSGAQGRPGS